jgi:peroxiredoxin
MQSVQSKTNNFSTAIFQSLFGQKMIIYVFFTHLFCQFKNKSDLCTPQIKSFYASKNQIAEIW